MVGLVVERQPDPGAPGDGVFKINPTGTFALGNAIASVEAGVILEHAPIRDVGDLLGGRTAGVVVLPGTGVAGGGPKIEVRGRTTISLQSEPLIYVDGVRSNNDVATGPLIGSSGRFASRLGDLNPEEIESIEIIRGPAAATLYGTEASNGVIQIITKKGRSGQRPTVALSVSQGANWFLNADERIPTNWARDPATGEIFEYDHLAVEQAAGRPIFSTGHLQGYNGDLSGATGIVRYFLSAGFDSQEGIEPTNRFKRFSARANLTVAPSNAFDATANMGITRAHRDFNLDRGLSLMFALLFGNPATRNTPLRGFNGAPPEVWWNAYETFQDVDRSFKLLNEFVHGPGYVHVSKRSVELAFQLLPRLFGLCLNPAAGRVPSKRPVLSDPDRVVARLDRFITAYGARPVLFEIAADLTEMQLKAHVDEASVGEIAAGQPVAFRVDAYPGESFSGRVEQVRLNPTVEQNVVTYAAIISAPNPGLKLKPGMTAIVTVETARRDDVLRVPNAALRYKPTPPMGPNGKPIPQAPEAPLTKGTGRVSATARSSCCPPPATRLATSRC